MANVQLSFPNFSRRFRETENQPVYTSAFCFLPNQLGNTVLKRKRIDLVLFEAKYIKQYIRVRGININIIATAERLNANMKHLRKS